MRRLNLLKYTSQAGRAIMTRGQFLENSLFQDHPGRKRVKVGHLLRRRNLNGEVTGGIHRVYHVPHICPGYPPCDRRVRRGNVPTSILVRGYQLSTVGVQCGAPIKFIIVPRSRSISCPHTSCPISPIALGLSSYLFHCSIQVMLYCSGCVSYSTPYSI